MGSPRPPRAAPAHGAQAGLFSATPATDAPLAERMRPRDLDEVVGQPALAGADGYLRRAVAAERLPSMILWGPPGTGKTTLARLLARGRARFVALSAVLSGVAQVRSVVAEAQQARNRGLATVLFVDEIHRFHKGQQDAFLPHVEAGTITLVGATTENPAFSLNSALLSRCAVLVVEPLAPEALQLLLSRALADERGYGGAGLTASADALARIAKEADGDARRALSLLEAVAEPVLEAAATDPELGAHVDLPALERVARHGGPRYDRGGDTHFHLLSALIKSLRGSDVDAALYWLARMLTAGEDPRAICRRLVVFASEDVGNADPRALPLAMAAAQAHELVGLPESRIPMAQAVTFLATAPKSDASYRALNAATRAAQAHGSQPVPLRLRNASTALARRLGYGDDYRNPHRAGGFEPERYLPDALAGAQFYVPTANGYEARIAARLQAWRALRAGDATPTEPDAARVDPPQGDS